MLATAWPLTGWVLSGHSLSNYQMVVGETLVSPPLMASTVCSSELEVQEERKGGLASVSPTENQALCGCFLFNTTLQMMPTWDSETEMSQERSAKMESPTESWGSQGGVVSVA